MRRLRMGSRGDAAWGSFAGRWTSPAVRAAAAGACLTLALACLASSPLLQVRTVCWTGPLRLADERHAALEAASLGRPLLLLSERHLRETLGLGGTTLGVSLRRHLPHTLEVRLAPHRAVASLQDGTPVDAHGRALGPEHAALGLPSLSGFELAPGGRRLAPAARALLDVVRPLFGIPTLAPTTVRLEGDDLQLVLADTGSRVRCEAAQAAEQLHKLRVLEEALGGDPMPAWIDLRFQDQVVVREGGGRRARRPR